MSKCARFARLLISSTSVLLAPGVLRPNLRMERLHPKPRLQQNGLGRNNQGLHAGAGER